jgi:hypothetical protein
MEIFINITFFFPLIDYFEVYLLHLEELNEFA